MTKLNFLFELREKLKGLPQNEIDERLNFYSEMIEDMVEEIFNTWKGEKLPPKIHFSSPRSGEFDKKHADYINAEAFIEFLEKTKKLDKDYDVMLECKEKDVALFKLVDDIKELRPDYTWLDKTTLLI
jgi:UV DNA damage endonuclease